MGRSPEGLIFTNIPYLSYSYKTFKDNLPCKGLVSARRTVPVLALFFIKTSPWAPMSPLVFLAPLPHRGGAVENFPGKDKWFAHKTVVPSDEPYLRVRRLRGKPDWAAYRTSLDLHYEREISHWFRSLRLTTACTRPFGRVMPGVMCKMNWKDARDSHTKNAWEAEAADKRGNRVSVRATTCAVL